MEIKNNKILFNSRNWFKFAFLVASLLNMQIEICINPSSAECF